MKSIEKTGLAILLLASFFCAACHRKASEESVMMPEGSPQEMETLLLSENERIDLTFTDTSACYFGKIGETRCFVKVDSSAPDLLKGHYFPIDSSGWTSPYAFEIRYTDGNYLFRSGSSELNLRFNVQLNPFHIIGSYQTSWLMYDRKEIVLERYEEPFFTTYNTTLNMLLPEPEIKTYKVFNNLVYGKARGYWTSNPEHEDKFAKVITKSILKTFQERNVDLALDLYVPEDSLPKHPMIMFIHGGAFYIGDKAAETMTTWCRHFAQLGYVTASINYRMGFKLKKNSIQQCGYKAIQDARAALRYLTARASQYRIDTQFIFLAGTSAGSITALAAAFWTPENRPDFIEANGLENLLGTLDGSGNSDSVRFRIRAIANMWGALYDLNELNGHSIPIISFHGTADNIVPYNEGIPFSSIGEKLFDHMYGSYAIHERLNQLGVRNEFYPIEEASHAPYQDNKGRPNECYFFIQGHMQEFFNSELRHIGRIRYDRPWSYTLEQPDVRALHWKAEGGFILRSEEHTVQVVWRRDVPKHKLTASGLRENGIAFTKTISIKTK